PSRSSTLAVAAPGGRDRPIRDWKAIGRFSLSVENEQADAGRDGRTRLARPNYQARTVTGKYSFSLFS
ncbi:unnamed protein product, partial [Ascophyllum nodosum]